MWAHSRRNFSKARRIFPGRHQKRPGQQAPPPLPLLPPPPPPTQDIGGQVTASLERRYHPHDRSTTADDGAHRTSHSGHGTPTGIAAPAAHTTQTGPGTRRETMLVHVGVAGGMTGGTTRAMRRTRHRRVGVGAPGSPARGTFSVEGERRRRNGRVDTYTRSPGCAALTWSFLCSRVVGHLRHGTEVEAKYVLTYTMGVTQGGGSCTYMQDMQLQV